MMERQTARLRAWMKLLAIFFAQGQIVFFVWSLLPSGNGLFLPSAEDVVLQVEGRVRAVPVFSHPPILQHLS